MQFRTQIPISKINHPIGYDSKVVSLGSCFAVNMAEKFDYFQFMNAVNPFGILFHPLAIEKLLGWAENRTQFTEADVFLRNERWHSFDVHSDLSDANQQNLLQKVNDAIEATHLSISQASHIIITYGTAWVYREKVSSQVVANCHKVPQIEFLKEILSVDAIGESVRNTTEIITRLNPNANIIFTVSPVRHLKDGFVENQHSKSNLISALQGFLNAETQANATYFPSYEIMMDELRDYRFYAQDMIHPNQIAIDYIWERFAQTHLAAAAHPIIEQVEQIRKRLAHRPFNPDSDSHRKFEARIQESIADLKTRFPHMHF